MNFQVVGHIQLPRFSEIPPTKVYTAKEHFPFPCEIDFTAKKIVAFTIPYCDEGVIVQKIDKIGQTLHISYADINGLDLSLSSEHGLFHPMQLYIAIPKDEEFDDITLKPNTDIRNIGDVNPEAKKQTLRLKRARIDSIKHIDDPSYVEKAREVELTIDKIKADTLARMQGPDLTDK